MMRQKFGRQANTNKQTGDPSCLPEVRRAKHIARSILARGKAVNLGGTVEVDDEEVEGLNRNGGTLDSARSGQIRHQPCSKPGSSVVKNRVSARRLQSQKMLQCMERVASTFDSMEAAVSQQSCTSLETIVRYEGSKALSETNKTLADVKSLLPSLQTNK